MGQQQAVELLFDQLGGLAAEHRLATPASLTNLGGGPHPVSFMFKSNFPPEPLFKRLYSAKISQALWLVRFSGSSKSRQNGPRGES